MKHTCMWLDENYDHEVMYRDVHMNTLTDEVESFPPKRGFIERHRACVGEIRERRFRWLNLRCPPIQGQKRHHL